MIADIFRERCVISRNHRGELSHQVELNHHSKSPLENCAQGVSFHHPNSQRSKEWVTGKKEGK